MMIFDFTKDTGMQNWYVVNDTVMGGESAENMGVNNEGRGVFEGHISLSNNGGFSSIKFNAGRTKISDYSKFVIALKGDGKAYQFRVKTKSSQNYSYVSTFATNNNWQMIEVPFDSMVPSFRGRTLEMVNFPGDYMEEIGFLIGNKKEEDFKLEIDYISVQ